jgi:hypothetical protein
MRTRAILVRVRLLTLSVLCLNLISVYTILFCGRKRVRLSASDDDECTRCDSGIESHGLAVCRAIARRSLVHVCPFT